MCVRDKNGMYELREWIICFGIVYVRAEIDDNIDCEIRRGSAIKAKQ